MFDLLNKPSNEVDEEDLRQLIAQKVPEGEQIEYKGDLPSKARTTDPWRQGKGSIGDYARNQILKEIAAFANAQGGMLLLGMKESKEKPPVAVEISELPRCADLADRISKMAGACVEPKIPQLEAFGVPTNGEDGVVIVRVGRSQKAPHRVEPTLECPVRRADRSEVMTMREIQDLTLNVSRDSERFEKGLSERLQRFEQEFKKLSNPDRSFGVRLTAVPVSADVQFEQVFRNGGIGEYSADWCKVTTIGEDQPLDNPRIFWNSEWSPILRGARLDTFSYTEALLHFEYREIHCDGLLEIGLFDCRDLLFLEFNAMPVLFANTITWARHVRNLSASPLTDYRIEVEIVQRGNEARVGNPDPIQYSMALQISRQDGNTQMLDESFPPIRSVKFPQYSVGEDLTSSELLQKFMRDFWHSLRKDFRQGSALRILNP